MQIPVIDIFAGPGGLGEGFSAAEEPISFSIKLSIEKDAIAHRTLQLRSFLRAFGYGQFPKEYYDYVRGSAFSKQQLFAKYSDKAEKAFQEAWQIELGPKSSAVVHERIKQTLDGSKHWILLGGPPCQAYSLVGRARMTGLGIKGRDHKLSEKDLKALKKNKLDKFNDDHRHTLYKEYLKIVAVHKPTVFVMENVKGILSAKHGEDPIFEKILTDLQDPWTAIASDEIFKNDAAFKSSQSPGSSRYRLFSFVTGTEPRKTGKLNPKDFIIRAEDYGIPQRRHRVIILGVLEGYDVLPKTLQKTEASVTVRMALESLPELRSGLSKEIDSADLWRDIILKGFSPSILNRMHKDIAPVLMKALKCLKNIETRGGRYVHGLKKGGNADFNHWISDPLLKGALQHETRGHMNADLWRYIYAASYAEANGHSPTIENLPKWLLPDHKNILADKSRDEEIHFKDRFKVQVADEPATTVTSHISKDGHYYIHYDPAQCRSFTVREAARLQTFPDNYFFEGNRTQQYHQVGNAVPPLLARKLAHVVSDVLEQCLETDRLTEAELIVKKREKRRA